MNDDEGIEKEKGIYDRLYNILEMKPDFSNITDIFHIIKEESSKV